VRGFLLELVPRAHESLAQSPPSKLNKNVLAICNMDMVNKGDFDPIFEENMIYMLELVKSILQK
jgi:hypothetical protein